MVQKPNFLRFRCMTSCGSAIPEHDFHEAGVITSSCADTRVKFPMQNLLRNLRVFGRD